MNRAEYITAVVSFAIERNAIGKTEACRILLDLATILNNCLIRSGNSEPEEVTELYEKIHRRYGWIVGEKPQC